jgi:hypothetical protein
MHRSHALNWLFGPSKSSFGILETEGKEHVTHYRFSNLIAKPLEAIRPRKTIRNFFDGCQLPTIADRTADSPEGLRKIPSSSPFPKAEHIKYSR